MKPALLLALALAFPVLAPPARAQTVEGAPAYVDYQGTAFDSTGKPLGVTGAAPPYTAAPTNYTMQFRIYDSQSLTTGLIYGETQTVTVSGGNFAVRLGSGTAITGFTSLGPPALSIASAFNSKDRYLELTVITNPPNPGTPITPRLAFQASPFSFVAQRAKLADSVNGVVTATAGSTFTGTVNATGGTLTGNFSGGNFTGGTYSGNGSGLTTISGAQLNSNSIDLTRLVDAVKQALCPPGTIVAYGGTTAPAGWLVCNGGSIIRTAYPALFAAIGTSFGSPSGTTFQVPDFRGRFLRGWSNGSGWDPDANSRVAWEFGSNSGDAIGSLQFDAFKAHTHGYTKPNISAQADDSGSAYREVDPNEGAATTASTGGSETRPVNVYVNYIIKY